jgi:hypothetical protein
MFNELKDKGLGVVAFTGSTEPDSAQEWIKYNNVTVPLILAEYDDSTGAFIKYKAGNGTYYIVDSTGKIIYSGGYDMYAIRKTLADLGIK